MSERFPLVVWQGKQPLRPKEAGLYRLVARGPARPERPDDVPFALERRVGRDAMKQDTWAPPRDQHGMLEAVWALSHAFGLLLSVDPRKLNLDHPLYCELNLAIAEGREPRGCDCPKE